MKKIFLAVLISFIGTYSFALTPRSLTYVCARIQNPDQNFACIRAGKNRYMDELALGACDRISSISGTISCVEAIAGKEYSQEEVRDCDSWHSVQSTIRCFEVAGQKHRRRGRHRDRDRSRDRNSCSFDVPHLKDLVQKATRAHRRGNSSKLEKILRRMENALQN